MDSDELKRLIFRGRCLVCAAAILLLVGLAYWFRF